MGGKHSILNHHTCYFITTTKTSCCFSRFSVQGCRELLPLQRSLVEISSFLSLGFIEHKIHHWTVDLSVLRVQIDGHAYPLLLDEANCLAGPGQVSTRQDHVGTM